MFPTVSRCEAYLMYTVSVTLDMEFAASCEEVAKSVEADLLNAWIILRSCPIGPTGAIVSTTFAYGDTTQFATVGPRILRGNGVSVHGARVTHAHVGGRWLAFTPPMEKLLLVPTSRKATMPEIEPDILQSLERFAQTRLENFVETQCAHARFNATIRTDDVGAVFVASRAQALLVYFNATDTSFTSRHNTIQSDYLTPEVECDDAGWSFDVPDILQMVPSRVLVADALDVATSYIENTFHPLDFVLFAPRKIEAPGARHTDREPVGIKPMASTFEIIRVVEVEAEAPAQADREDGDFVLV